MKGSTEIEESVEEREIRLSRRSERNRALDVDLNYETAEQREIRQEKKEIELMTGCIELKKLLSRERPTREEKEMAVILSHRGPNKVLKNEKYMVLLDTVCHICMVTFYTVMCNHASLSCVVCPITLHVASTSDHYHINYHICLINRQGQKSC